MSAATDELILDLLEEADSIGLAGTYNIGRMPLIAELLRDAAETIAALERELATMEAQS